MLSWWPGGLGEGQSCPSKDSSHIVWVWCVAWALGSCWHTDRALWVLGYKLSYSFGEGHAYYRRLCYIIIPPDPIGILQCSFGASSVLLVPITTCEFIIPKEKKKNQPKFSCLLSATEAFGSLAACRSFSPPLFLVFHEKKSRHILRRVITIIYKGKRVLPMQHYRCWALVNI